MKKKMVLVATMIAAAWSAWSAERITIDKVSNHYPWDGKVDCVCTLRGVERDYTYKGAFTLSVEKSGTTVRKVITNAFGSANGTYTNTFDCVALFGAGVYPNGGIVVDLIKEDDRTGDPIGIAGDVLVIDVSAGSTAASYPTKELTGVDIGTFNCAVYKTDKIVLKKVPAGTYVCQPREWDDSTLDNPATQRLTTKDFYIGVFPVTQRQYERVMGTNPSHFTTYVAGNAAAQRPVENVSWNTIRGSEEAGAEITASSADSFLMRLVAKTGLSGFDLPTEAQWEIACRANVTAAYGAYWNGTTAVELTSSNHGDAAWYDYNSSSTTHAVGGKRPNLWGFYDMQGNVMEWCRDIYITPYSTMYVDTPCTETSFGLGGYRVARGGCWNNSAERCRPSNRGNWDAGFGISIYGGFRLSRTLP